MISFLIRDPISREYYRTTVSLAKRLIEYIDKKHRVQALETKVSAGLEGLHHIPACPKKENTEMDFASQEPGVAGSIVSFFSRHHPGISEVAVPHAGLNPG